MRLRIRFFCSVMGLCLVGCDAKGSVTDTIKDVQKTAADTVEWGKMEAEKAGQAYSSVKAQVDAVKDGFQKAKNTVSSISGQFSSQ